MPDEEHLQSIVHMPQNRDCAKSLPKKCVTNHLKLLACVFVAQIFDYRLALLLVTHYALKIVVRHRPDNHSLLTYGQKTTFHGGNGTHLNKKYSVKISVSYHRRM
jgi:hypothetical protein